MPAIPLPDLPPEPCVNDVILNVSIKCVNGKWVGVLTAPPIPSPTPTFTASASTDILSKAIEAGWKPAQVLELAKAIAPPAAKPCG